MVLADLVQVFLHKELSVTGGLRCLFLLSDILNHEELQGNIKTACLGSLLLQDHLDRLEDQYLSHKEVKTSSQEPILSAFVLVTEMFVSFRTK